MKLNKFLAIFAALSLVTAPSCNDDDGDLTPLTEVAGENTTASHNTLTFAWDKVAGATQYGYELYGSDGNLVIRSVTGKTDVTISNLKPATEYTLKVWAYAAIGSDYTSSEPFVLTATTAALKKLGSPTIEYSRTGSTYTFTWKKVTKATAYEYVLFNEADEIIESGTNTSRSLKFSDLELGNYKLTLKATTTDDAYESAGETVSIDFTVEEVFVWKATGTYTSSILGNSWEAEIVYYGDDNYSIKGWYGVDGYNLSFYTDDSDPEDMFSISGNYDYDSSSYLFGIATGRTDIAKVWIYPWYNYCEIIGNKASGSVSLYVYNPSTDDYSTDTFTWVGEQSGAPADDFVGTWTESLTGFTYITDPEGDFNYTGFEVEITKVDDYTIAMPALYFTDDVMHAKINLADGTLTAQPVTVWTYYTLAGNESETAPIIGKINDDGSLEFTDWNAWYGSWVYFDNAVAKFKR